MTEESKSQTANNKDSQQVSSGSGASGLPLAMASVSMVMAVLAGGASFYVWDNLTKASQFSQTNVQSAITQAEKNTDDFRGDINRFKQSVSQVDLRITKVSDDIQLTNKSMAQLQNTQEGFVTSLRQLREELGRSATGWQLAEVLYLLDIANQQLELQKNVATATAAMEAADRKLLALGDPAFLKVREKILSEVGALKALRPLDRAGIAMQVRGVAEQVKSLKLKSVEYAPEKVVADGLLGKQEAIAQSALGWQDKLKAAWSEFLVAIEDTVHIRNQRVIPMLSADQEYFLYKNMALKLESAQLAVLKEDNLVFYANLDTALDDLNEYFDPEDVATINAKNALQQLRKENLEVALPDLSGSLRLLKQEIARLNLGAEVNAQ